MKQDDLETIIADAHHPIIQDMWEPDYGDIYWDNEKKALSMVDKEWFILNRNKDETTIWLPVQFNAERLCWQWEVVAGKLLKTGDPDKIRESFDNFVVYEDGDIPFSWTETKSI